MPDESSIEEKSGLRLALRIISRKSCTRQEMAEKLGRKGFSKAAILKSIGRLEELGYLDDQEYAYNYALSKASEKMWGSARIASELRRKGLPEGIVKSALEKLEEEVNEEEILERALQKKVGMMKKLSSERDIRQVYGYLVRRGFPVHLIVKKLKRLDAMEGHES